MERAVLSPGGRRHWLLVGAAVLPLVALNGCSSMSNSESGALIGGTAGAVGGGIIGHALHNTGAGAVIGGLTGAVAGAVIGDKKDQKEATQAYTAARQTTIADVIRLTHDHVSDTIIINQVRNCGVVFHLTAAEIDDLKANGVSDPVITEMQASGPRPRRVVYADPPVVAQPVYVVEQPPPPRVSVGIGYAR